GPHHDVADQYGAGRDPADIGRDPGGDAVKGIDGHVSFSQFSTIVITGFIPVIHAMPGRSRFTGVIGFIAPSPLRGEGRGEGFSLSARTPNPNPEPTRPNDETI